MSNLITLRDRSQPERLRLLRESSASLLPSPGVGEDLIRIENERAVKDLLIEIRQHLNLSETDTSVRARSRILGLLSAEISEVVFAGADFTTVESRLGERGALHPSQYQVAFGEHIEVLENLGTRRNHLADAILRPDKLLHMQPKYLTGSADPRITISVKYVDTKRVEDKFAFLVFSQRKGRFQEVMGGFRAYRDEVDLRNANEPLEVLHSFIKRYGVTFRIRDGAPTTLLENDIISVSTSFENLWRHELRPVAVAGQVLWPLLAGDVTDLLDPEGGVLGEVTLAFLLNLSEYIETLRRHKVNVPPDLLSRFKRGLYFMPPST